MAAPFPPSRQTGGTWADGPTNTGKRPRFATGDWRASNAAVNIDGTTQGPGSLDFDIGALGVASAAGSASGSQIWGNWRYGHPRTVKALDHGMQNQNYSNMPLFVVRWFPENKKDIRVVGDTLHNESSLVKHSFADVAPFLGLDYERTVSIEELYTLPGMNYHLYKQQELLYTLAYDRTGARKRDAMRAQDDFESNILRTIAFCGVGRTETHLGLRDSDVPGPAPTASAQKRVLTITEGQARIHNVWGRSYKDGTRLYFIVKRLSENEIPSSYNFVQNQDEVTRDAMSGELSVHTRIKMRADEDPPKFCPWQIVPFARGTAREPAMADRSYLNPDGSEGFGKYIGVGKFYYNTQPGKNMNPLNPDAIEPKYVDDSEQMLPYNTRAVMVAAQIEVHFDVENPVQPLDKPARMQYNGPRERGPDWQAHHIY